jgi:hypothetical protein
MVSVPAAMRVRHLHFAVLSMALSERVSLLPVLH